MKWRSINVCVECEHQLDRHDEFYSRGVCPHCGCSSDTTICNTRKVIYQILNSGTFFFRKISYVGKDAFSKQWILKNKL